MAMQHLTSIKLLVFATFFASISFAQNKNDTAKSNSSSNEDKTLQQIIEYSRPGKYHQLLGDLVGSWKFSGSHFEWVDSVTNKVAVKLFGTVVRKSFANGRYFIVEATTGGKLQLPIQNGKMIEGYGKIFQTEGYNNVKKKFELSYIGNHFGSELAFWEVHMILHQEQ
jgi:hypothetical protein